jgi:hypothetical protein
MRLYCVIAWFLLLLTLELLSTRSVQLAFGLLAATILTLISLAFLYGLDLVGVLLLATYSSVFLLLSLFLLYFNRYWQLSFGATQHDLGRVLALGGALVLIYG